MMKDKVAQAQEWVRNYLAIANLTDTFASFRPPAGFTPATFSGARMQYRPLQKSQRTQRTRPSQRARARPT